MINMIFSGSTFSQNIENFTHATILLTAIFGFFPDVPNFVKDIPTLFPAMSLKGRIINIHTAKVGTGVSYCHTFIADKDTQIATIPIGYADGFDRRFSNYGGEVLVRGKRCPVVGNVCMDQAMIDVTGTDAQPGDYAIVFGDQLPIQELADKLQTIPYEVLTSISRRVQRVYFYE